MLLLLLLLLLRLLLQTLQLPTDNISLIHLSSVTCLSLSALELYVALLRGFLCDEIKKKAACLARPALNVLALY